MHKAVNDKLKTCSRALFTAKIHNLKQQILNLVQKNGLEVQKAGLEQSRTIADKQMSAPQIAKQSAINKLPTPVLWIMSMWS